LRSDGEVEAGLDRAFLALADPVRRAIVARLSRGPARNELTIERWDFRTGSGYRYLHLGPDGGEYWFNGVYHVVREPELISQTFEFEGAPDMVNIEFMRFEDVGGGRSQLRGRGICPSVEARDGLLSSGMEGGMTEYERLESLLAVS
jgi:uncharacterized protein YndB with AHSA1/START domain